VQLQSVGCFVVRECPRIAVVCPPIGYGTGKPFGRVII
jgi:hypothetical protein